MKKLQPNKTVLWVTLVVLVVAGVVGYASYQYQTNRKPAPTVSAAQALKERDEAVRVMNLHDAVNQRNLANEQTATQTVQTKLTAVCTHLTTLKVTDPNCK